VDETMEYSVNTVADLQETGAHSWAISRDQFFYG